MKPPASYLHPLAAELDGGLHCTTVLRVCLSLMALHGLGSAAFITGACQVSRLHLVISRGGILRNGHCQIMATEIRALPGRVQTQQFQASIAAPDYMAMCVVDAILHAPPGMHFDLASIGNVHASSSAQCLLLIRAGRGCLPCRCAVSTLPERIVLLTSSTCTPIATDCSSATVSFRVAVGPNTRSFLYPSSFCLVRPVSSGSGQSSWTRVDLSRSFGAVFGGREACVAVKGIACARSLLCRERDLW